MFCKRCGKELPANATFCPYCGNKIIVIEKIENADRKQEVPEKMSRFAITGLVCGILSIWPLAILFGWLALNKIKHFPKLKGKKIAIAGIIIGCLWFPVSFLARVAFFQPFKISSTDMCPTLEVGDRLMANKLVYKFREPERGEIVIFKYPLNPKKSFVKRLIGLPGEELMIREGKIFINGEPVKNPSVNSRDYYNNGLYGTEFPAKIPEGSYYVLGDNSTNSKDSRYWGFVPKKNLIGKASFIYLPFGRIGGIK